MKNSIAAQEREQLVQQARKTAEFAYAPYSRFRVGAAVLGEQTIYSGTNVENASFGLTLCAERSALSAAVAAGDHRIRAIAVACIDANPGDAMGAQMPCGACRQWISELAPNATIFIAGRDEEFVIGDLLPHAFRLT